MDLLSAGLNCVVFRSMDDFCNVLISCIVFFVKTNQHNSTASEAGLFLKLILNLEALERQEKWADTTLMGGTAHNE